MAEASFFGTQRSSSESGFTSPPPGTSQPPGPALTSTPPGPPAGSGGGTQATTVAPPPNFKNATSLANNFPSSNGGVTGPPTGGVTTSTTVPPPPASVQTPTSNTSDTTPQQLPPGPMNTFVPEQTQKQMEIPAPEQRDTYVPPEEKGDSAVKTEDNSNRGKDIEQTREENEIDPTNFKTTDLNIPVEGVDKGAVKDLSDAAADQTTDKQVNADTIPDEDDKERIKDKTEEVAKEADKNPKKDDSETKCPEALNNEAVEEILVEESSKMEDKTETTDETPTPTEDSKEDVGADDEASNQDMPEEFEIFEEYYNYVQDDSFLSQFAQEGLGYQKGYYKRDPTNPYDANRDSKYQLYDPSKQSDFYYDDNVGPGQNAHYVHLKGNYGKLNTTTAKHTFTPGGPLNDSNANPGYNRSSEFSESSEDHFTIGFSAGHKMQHDGGDAVTMITLDAQYSSMDSDTFNKISDSANSRDHDMAIQFGFHGSYKDASLKNIRRSIGDRVVGAVKGVGNLFRR